MTKYLFPNIISVVLVQGSMMVSSNVRMGATLSFIGLGVQPPDPSLGRMLSEAQAYIFTAPWYAIWPGVVIVLIILGFSQISEGLRAISD